MSFFCSNFAAHIKLLLMRKILFLAFVLQLSAISVMAQESAVQKLNVWKMDGTRIQFLLTDEPVTTFENGNLVLTTNQGVFSYPLAQMKQYTHEGMPEGIDAPSVAPGDILVRQNDEQLLIEGLPDGKTVDVYSADGKLIVRQKAVGGQGTLLSLTGQPQGTYVVTIGSTTFKFVKP